MSVDLISALDVRETEETRPSESVGQGGEAFPSVFRSSLEDADSGQDPGTASASGEAVESKDANTSNASNEASGEQGDEEAATDAATQTSLDGQASAEAESEDNPASVADGVALGAAAAVLSTARSVLGEAVTDIEGRLTSLDRESSEGRPSDRNAERVDGEASTANGGGVRGVDLTAEETALVDAALAREEQAGSADPKPAVSGEAVATTTRLDEGGQQLAGGAEVRTNDVGGLDPQTGAPRDDDPSGRERNSQDQSETRQGNEQARFAQSAEAAANAADANARQAIANDDTARRAPDTVAVEAAGLVANPVAGTTTETTTTSTPGAPTPPAASDAISVQTEWLAGRGGGTARLLLSPPTLGEIAIQVTLRGGAVNVVMVAQEALAQSVAEDQSDRLAQAFSSRDLRMDNFEVRRGDPAQLSSADLASFAESEFREGGQAGDEEGAHDRLGSDRSGDDRDAAPGKSEREAPSPPQILSMGPEAAVDLRI